MTKKNVKPAPSKYFHEVMKEEQELLKLSYEESVRQREERKNKKRKLPEPGSKFEGLCRKINPVKY